MSTPPHDKSGDDLLLEQDPTRLDAELAPRGTLARLEAMVEVPGVDVSKLGEPERWMHALAWVEHRHREYQRLKRRNAVLERRARLLVEVAEGAVDRDDL